MFLSLRCSLVALSSSFASSNHEWGQCLGEDHCQYAGVASLLQSRHGIERGTLPEDFSSSAQSPVALVLQSQERHQSFADATDNACVPGGGCIAGVMPSTRGVCVARAPGRNDCWDICNLAHDPKDYVTGNAMLDVTVQDAVKVIRDGKVRSVSCLADNPYEADRQPPTGLDIPEDVRAEVHDAPQMEKAHPVPQMPEPVQIKGPGGTHDASQVEKPAGEAPQTAQQDPQADIVEQLANTAALDEAGYKKVAALNSHSAMEAYIRRVVSNTGCRVADESKLEGVVAYYDGESATQSYSNLEAEIYKACTGTGTWLTSKYSKEIMLGPDGMPPGSSLGSTAPITEQGFQEVVLLKDDLQILKYARRVVSMLHGWVVDESGLHGLLPFFTGEKSVQTLGALILEIETAMTRPDSWVMKAPDSTRDLSLLESSSNSSADEEVIPATPLDTEGEVSKRLADISARAGKGATVFEECPIDDLEELNMLNHTAWAVPLDEPGYEAIAQLASDCAMMQFAIRVIEGLHCHVLDESGLKGMVPYYSGTQGTQDLHQLRTELHGVCSMEGKWLVPDVKYWAGQTVISSQENVDESEVDDVPDGETSAIEEMAQSVRGSARSVQGGETEDRREEALTDTGSFVDIADVRASNHKTKTLKEEATGLWKDPFPPSQPVALLAQKDARRHSNKAWRRSFMCRTLKLFCPPTKKAKAK